MAEEDVASHYEVLEELGRTPLPVTKIKFPACLRGSSC